MKRTLTTALLLAVPLALGSTGFLAAPAGAEDVVSLEKIMAHPDWLGRAPENAYWADDGESFYYHRKREGSEAIDLFHSSLDGSEVRRIEDAERGAVDVDGDRLSPDRNLKVYARHGDLYVRDLAAGTIRQLTRTAEAETHPCFHADGNGVIYRKGDNYFLRRLADGLEIQLTDLRLEDDPNVEEEDPSYLEAQQQRLFTYLSEQKQKREDAEERAETEQRDDPTRAPLPTYLGKGLEIETSLLSPNGRWLIVGVVSDTLDRGERTPMPVWVTDSGHIETRDVRPKVGSAEPFDERLLLVDLEQNRHWELDRGDLDGMRDDPLADLKAAAEARKDAAEDGEDGSDKGDGDDGGKASDDDEPKQPEPRANYVWTLAWSDDGEHVAIALRAYDNKDRWIVTVDPPAEGDGEGEPTLRLLHRLTDPGWINWRYNELGWLPDDETLYYLSEEDGWSGLYTVRADGSDRRTLAAGEFAVSEPAVSPDGSQIYFRANVDHPGDYEIYRVAVEGGATEQLTRLGGLNSARLSPTGERLLIEHSSLTRPPELYVQDAAPGAPAGRVTRTISDAFLEVNWNEPEIVEVPSSYVDRPIYSRLYRPTGDAPGGKRPAVVFVHGAGYLQNAHKGWSGYFREFMFHTLLTRRGYVVLDMDYRASAGYGRDWRTAIYRRMGTPELEDLQDGVAWLVENEGVDPARVGVYGGSYGGFMTMMALFKDPDLFAAGAALRPVTDWAHYNHPYTSNILNTPEVDPEAYERSSPIEFADGLERPLLICAPMLDDNVFFQDTVRLVQRLIELEKTGFETALFPVEPHGFREPSSWLNEYRRIYELFERFVRPAPDEGGGGGTEG